MKVQVNCNPIPAVRMTQRSMWYGHAKEYVEYKNALADELKLHLMGNTSGGIMTVEDKFAKQNLPLTRLLKLTVHFNRKDKRRADLDNLIKTVMDILQTAKVIWNDDQVREIHATLEKGQLEGNFEFVISPIFTPTTSPSISISTIKSGTYTQ